MNSKMIEVNNRFKAEKKTSTGRRLGKLIKSLSLRLVLYTKKGGLKPEINWEIFDLVTEFDKEIVALCRSRREYHYVMVQTISLFSARAAEYVYDMKPASFSRYCSERKRFCARNVKFKMPFVLKLFLLGVSK